MNVDKATEIINQIASKLGVAAEYIAPELARMQIAQYAMATALSVVFLVISVIVIKLERVNKPEDKWYDADFFGTSIMTFLSVTTVASLLVLVSSMYELSGWLASPTAKSIEYVMRALK